MLRYFILLIVTCTQIGLASGQTKSDIRYEDFVYASNIKTVNISLGNEISFAPILLLNSSQELMVRFDDTDESEKDYYYKIIHCNRDWIPSDIQEMEYIEGFNNEPLRDWEFSINTYVDYTHYWFTLPNRQTKFRISGNYILYVYQMNESEEFPLFTRRFMVSEEAISPNLNFVRPTNSSDIRYKQQMELELNIEGANIKFPERDLTVDILQNTNWNTRLKQIKPRFSSSNNVSFDVFGLLSFDANNEWRGFDTRSVNSVGFGIQSMERKNDGTDAFIFNKRRDGHVYGFVFDYNGKYYIDNPESVFATSIESLLRNVTNDLFTARRGLVSNSNTGSERNIRADYVDVHFSLETTEMPGDIYVFGGFTDFQLYPHYKMKYDLATGTYKTKVRIKQGYHDYMYAHVYNGKISFDDIEGNWQATENDYLILTYFRPFGTRYDRLISARNFNTLNSTFFKNIRK